MSQVDRYLVYTDLQATEGSEVCHANPAVPLQRYRVQKLTEKLLDLYDSNRCGGLIDLGDTTDDRSFIYRATLDCLLRGLAPFKPNKMGIKLTGNHEQLLKSTDVNSVELYRPYFGRVDVQLCDLGRGVTAVCQPFFEDYAAVNDRIRDGAKAAGDGPKVLLAHCDVQGVKYASGDTCRRGIDRRLFELFDLTLLGHVHKHQQLSPNVFYVGSPFQQDFGEAGEVKRVAILDVQGGTPKVEWQVIDGMPEYRQVSLEDFVSQSKKTEEHRYKVDLRSVEESATFFAHPRSSLGIPNPLYSQSKTEEVKQNLMPTSDLDLLTRYAKTRPISGVPDDVKADIVEFGMMLLRG